MLNLYSIYDRKAKLYSNPVVQTNDETAKRWFEYVVSNSDMVAKDLELFRIGQFEETFGQLKVSVQRDIDTLEQTFGDKDFICSADDIVTEVENNG